MKEDSPKRGNDLGSRPCPVQTINDRFSTSHADVMAAFDRAIAPAENSAHKAYRA